MADEDQENKTEQPTQKRLEEAYQKGNVPFSREVWIEREDFMASGATRFSHGHWTSAYRRSNTRSLINLCMISS